MSTEDARPHYAIAPQPGWHPARRDRTYYGDGAPIEPSVIDALHEAYRNATVSFPWEKGDLLMLDNMLVAHGRAPYTGAREILVGMAEPVSEDQVQR
jgi:hypothetical protein